MKKQLFSILAMAILALGLTSCSKDDPAQPVTVDETATATIIGYVSFVPDLTGAAKPAYPAGSNVTITATVPYSSLNGEITTTGNLEIAASYDATTGRYKIDVPATLAATASVTINVSAFTGDRINAADVREIGVWTPNPTTTTVSVSKGQTFKAANISYTFTAAPVQ